MLFKSYINVFLGQLEKRRCLALSGEGDSLSRAIVSRSLGRGYLALSGDSVSPTQAIEISQDIPLNLNNK